jgi:hypothetical protein
LFLAIFSTEHIYSIDLAQARTHHPKKVTEDFYGFEVKKTPSNLGECVTIKCVGSMRFNEKVVKIASSLVLVE